MWKTAWAAGEIVLGVLESELSNGSDPNSLAGVALVAPQLLKFIAKLRLHAQREAGLALRELERLGCPLDAALELATLSEEQVIEAWKAAHPGTAPVQMS